MDHRNLFKNVDVEDCPEGKEIKQIIKDNFNHLPKCPSSYKTSNGTYLEVSFGKDKLKNECCIRFFYRSWRWVNVHFYCG